MARRLTEIDKPEEEAPEAPGKAAAPGAVHRPGGGPPRRGSLLLPAAALAALFALGWGYAFLAKSALGPPEKPREGPPAVAPPREARPPSPAPPAPRESRAPEASRPAPGPSPPAPPSPASLPPASPQEVTFSLGDVFFIPLEVGPGGRRGGGEGRGEARFLRVALEVRVTSAPAAQEAKSKLPTLRGVVFQYFAAKPLPEVQRLIREGTVKEDLRRALNRHLTVGQVRDLFFSELHIL